MNSSQISAFIENPSLITANDVDSLKNLANEYSYSETLQFLYLYAVSKHADMKFDDALLSTAYRITHRERIVELLDASSDQGESAQEEEVVIEKSVVDEIVPVVEIPEVIESKEEIIEFAVAETTSSMEVETVLEQETTTEQVGELEELIYNTTATALEQDYLASQGITEVSVSEKEEETVTASDETPEPEEEKEVSVESSISEDSKMSFTSWLNQNQPSGLPEKEISTDAVPVKKHKEEIIDRFIETQPRISKPSAEFYSASKKAKESLDANRNPVSETLAKIYEAQGNYQKAIHVYHQLILNYPEKKSLFAPRIEELKNKISQ